MIQAYPVPERGPVLYLGRLVSGNPVMHLLFASRGQLTCEKEEKNAASMEGLNDTDMSWQSSVSNYSTAPRDEIEICE